MPRPRRSIPWVIAGGVLPAWTRRPRGGGSIGSRAAAALSARRGALPRPPDAGLGTGGNGYRFHILAGARHLTGALERAEISAQGGRFHRARDCRRAGAWARADARRRRLAGGRLSS